mmetsp:Transcript_102557/g.257003  ORF Transcript_102557/g.257003 Transcript_102557/m.257003 type:complete len:197 (+) Transcript_102557:44-634(+)
MTIRRSGHGARGRRSASLGLAALTALVGASCLTASSLFVQSRSAGPLSRRGVAMRATKKVQLKLGQGTVSNLEVSPRAGEGSQIKVVSANMPLGLKITMIDGGATVGNTFVVEQVMPGGAVSLGEADIRAGDVIHGVTTTVNGQKGALETHAACSTVDELSQAIMGNDDGEVTLVIERPGSGGSGLEWMQEVAGMF